MDISRNRSNRLLNGLSGADTRILRPFLAPVDLPARTRIESRNHAIRQVYFLGGGVASMVCVVGAHHVVEIAMIGNEGMTGLAVLLGADQTPHDTLMRSSGTGWCITVADLRLAMDKSKSLRHRLLRYAETLAVQISHTSLANARYKLNERLARWLLMAHDRSAGDDVIVTHDFLAIMLGTRRPGVTTAINHLAKAGLIKGGRGMITILDRAALEGAANGSYGAAEAEYERLLAYH